MRLNLNCVFATLLVLAFTQTNGLGQGVPEEVLEENPNVLPESEYPYWPSYNHLETNDLRKVRAQKWIAKEHTIDGWDWSMPDHVDPAPHSLVGLQRLIGWDKEYIPLDLKFKANGVGILWVRWRDIEPVEGKYNFNPIIHRIKQANKEGLDVILRVLTNSKGRGAEASTTKKGEAPLWLEAIGVPLLPKKRSKDNLNFDPAHPEFHKRYLKLVDEMAKAGIPDMVKAAYVGYASHSFGDEGIGPYGEAEADENDALPHVRERLDAWHKAFKGMEHKIFMGGSSHYGFEKGFGVRRGFVEMYLYNIPNEDLGQHIDSEGYLFVNEEAPVIKYQCFNGEVNEEYEITWATRERGYRFGSTTNSYPYRYFTSTLRALQMRCTYIHTTGHLIPEMLPFLSLELGRTVEDAPDVWTFLRTSHIRASNYRNKDTLGRPISQQEAKEGIEVKNFERWLYQRDATGFETRQAVKMQQPIKMWMVQTNKYYDHIARAGKRIGFDIDDHWKGADGQVAVKISYFDQKTGYMQLTYNGGKVIKTQKLMGDGKLKTITFIISELEPNSLQHGFDFSIEAGSNTPDVVVSMVRIVACDSELL